MYTKEEILAVYNKPEIKTGLKKYMGIMDFLYGTDVSKNREFQKSYNHFYRMRQRKPEFYEIYYNYMESMKKYADVLSFEEVFHFILKETGRYEASFSSKLLATLNPNKPVWDTYVLKNLGVKNINATDRDREQKIISAYDRICKWYDEFLNSEDSVMILETFDNIFPDIDITNVKKVDLFLWQHRAEKMNITPHDLFLHKTQNFFHRQN